MLSRLETVRQPIPIPPNTSATRHTGAAEVGVGVGVGIDTSRYGHYVAFLTSDLNAAAALCLSDPSRRWPGAYIQRQPRRKRVPVLLHELRQERGRD